jgi:hypothetical protein
MKIVPVIMSIGFCVLFLGNELQANEKWGEEDPILAVSQATPSSATLSTSSAQQTDASQVEAWKIEAAKVAKDYVNLLDQGKYAESWDTGSSIFQKTISKGEWVLALQLARQKLGKVQSRTLKDERPAWDPKGLPKGAYMVVEYNTSFAKAPNSGELLTLRLEPSGQWKILTYQVN